MKHLNHKKGCNEFQNFSQIIQYFCQYTQNGLKRVTGFN